ncbi:MAG: TIGR00730 family Rossman fold protein [Kofleriaceae bacterium]
MAAIGVFLSARTGVEPAHVERARRVGAALAAGGHEVVYGGASVGLMGVLADAALAAGGRVVGVIPRSMVDRELAHGGLTELHVVETMGQRKALMFDRADAFLVLPGGLGTLDEAFEMLTTQQLGWHAKPTVFLDEDGYWEGLFAWAARAVASGLLAEPHHALLLRATSIPAALAALVG